MQPLSASGRTEEDTLYVVRDAASVSVRSGLELLDQDLNLLEDISDRLVSGTITRSSTSVVHGSATLQIADSLPWGSAIVRPYITLTSDGASARFNLGAYYTSVPSYTTGQSSIVYDVSCTDILDLLDDPVGEAYGVETGITTVLQAVESILQNLGITQYALNQANYGIYPATSLSWPADEGTTWLTIVNDLLASIGYRNLYSNWDGVLVAEPYIEPVARPVEWDYSNDPSLSMHEPAITVSQDLYRMPNRWVFINSSFNDASAPPIEGAGVYTYTNESLGETSVDARGGRILTSVQSLDATSQFALVEAGNKIINEALHLAQEFSVTTSINPLHWHYDIVTLTDTAIRSGTKVTALSTSWTLPLSGNAVMSHTWTEVGNQ